MSDVFTVIDDIYDADGTLPGLLTNDLWLNAPPENTKPPFGRVEHIVNVASHTSGGTILENERVGITGYSKGPGAAEIRSIRDAIKGAFDNQNVQQDSVSYNFRRVQDYMILDEDGDVGWFFEFEVSETPS